jgi:hypothetical protein
MDMNTKPTHKKIISQRLKKLNTQTHTPHYKGNSISFICERNNIHTKYKQLKNKS